MNVSPISHNTPIYSNPNSDPDTQSQVKELLLQFLKKLLPLLIEALNQNQQNPPPADPTTSDSGLEAKLQATLSKIDDILKKILDSDGKISDADMQKLEKDLKHQLNKLLAELKQLLSQPTPSQQS